VPETVVEPGVGWSYQQGFGSEKRPKSLVAQLHVPLGTSLEALNGHLDTVKAAMDRQIALYELEEALLAVEEHRAKVREMHTVLATADESAKIAFEGSGRKGDWSVDKMTPAQRQAKAQAEGNLTRWEEGFSHWQARAQKLRERIDASNGSSNSHAGMSEG
jgi:hypothetical protein